MLYYNKESLYKTTITFVQQIYFKLRVIHYVLEIVDKFYNG